jgi:hypothetical protein
MTHAGKTRRRYLLVRSGKAIDQALKESVFNVVASKYPKIKRKEFVWYEKSFIVRGTLKEVRGIREYFADAKVLGLAPVLTSGTINKLKKLSDEERTW